MRVRDVEGWEWRKVAENTMLKWMCRVPLIGLFGNCVHVRG